MRTLPCITSRRVTTIGGLVAMVLVLPLSGCATVVSGRWWPVQVTSEPTGANFTIRDGKGKIINHGTTPAQVTFESGGGYFKRGDYEITFEKAGFATTQRHAVADFNYWYLGNIVLGGIIGFVIVDPLSGAMYRFDSDHPISCVLERSSAAKPSTPAVPPKIPVSLVVAAPEPAKATVAPTIVNEVDEKVPLSDAPAVKKTEQSPSTSIEKLKKLHQLHQEGLIDDADYARRKQDILDNL